MIGKLLSGDITLSINGVEIGKAQSITFTPSQLPDGATGYSVHYEPAYPPPVPVRHMKSRKWFRRRNKAYWRSQQRKPMGTEPYRYTYHLVKGVEE